jgi:hypothetical protein
MKKKIIKKILTSKKARKAVALSMFVMAMASVAQPWSDKM